MHSESPSPVLWEPRSLAPRRRRESPIHQHEDAGDDEDDDGVDDDDDNYDCLLYTSPSPRD